jgi:hypothetical protein
MKHPDHLGHNLGGLGAFAYLIYKLILMLVYAHLFQDDLTMTKMTTAKRAAVIPHNQDVSRFLHLYG